MPANPYSVETIPGLRRSERRGIVFLICEDDDGVDAKAVFRALEKDTERLLRTRFDHWIDGGTNDRWFHGFNDPEHRECFVFKWKKRRQNHRLYGFLYHPMPKHNPRFQICVLASHAKKAQKETDPNELDSVAALRNNPNVRKAISIAFPDSSGRNRWLN